MGEVTLKRASYKRHSENLSLHPKPPKSGPPPLEGYLVNVGVADQRTRVRFRLAEAPAEKSLHPRE